MILMTIPLINYSFALYGHQIHAHADIYTRHRKHIVAQKSVTHFYGKVVREIKAYPFDDTEDCTIIC